MTNITPPNECRSRKECGKTSQKHLILGVDPGFSGAFALYDINTRRPFMIWDMPVLTIKDKKEINYYEVNEALSPYYSLIRFAVVEKVHAMPGQGVSSMFRFGYGAGILTGILAAHKVEMIHTPPDVWKPLMNLTRDKNYSRLVASKLFPTYAAHFARKKDDGRAEALLLALFGAERLT